MNFRHLFRTVYLLLGRAGVTILSSLTGQAASTLQTFSTALVINVVGLFLGLFIAWIGWPDNMWLTNVGRLIIIVSGLLATGFYIATQVRLYVLRGTSFVGQGLVKIVADVVNWATPGTPFDPRNLQLIEQSAEAIRGFGRMFTALIMLCAISAIAPVFRYPLAFLTLVLTLIAVIMGATYFKVKPSDIEDKVVKAFGWVAVLILVYMFLPVPWAQRLDLYYQQIPTELEQARQQADKSTIPVLKGSIHTLAQERAKILSKNKRTDEDEERLEEIALELRDLETEAPLQSPGVWSSFRFNGVAIAGIAAVIVILIVVLPGLKSSISTTKGSGHAH